jgi:hypothetical protein
MPRRKKGFNLNLILVCLVLVVGTWIAADYYFNVARQPKKEPAVEVADTQPAAKETPASAQKEPVAPEISAFETKTYRDDRFGFEFQYPEAVKDTVLCPKFEKTDDGFNLNIFSLTTSIKQGELGDYIGSAMQGMNIDKRENITVAGIAATRIDYQTTGMGWYGSSTFIENGGRVYEFGLLANESSEKCGGADNYEDMVYQAAISTLKFNN